MVVNKAIAVPLRTWIIKPPKIYKFIVCQETEIILAGHVKNSFRTHETMADLLNIIV